MRTDEVRTALEEMPPWSIYVTTYGTGRDRAVLSTFRREPASEDWVYAHYPYAFAWSTQGRDHPVLGPGRVIMLKDAETLARVVGSVELITGPLTWVPGVADEESLEEMLTLAYEEMAIYAFDVPSWATVLTGGDR